MKSGKNSKFLLLEDEEDRRIARNQVLVRPKVERKEKQKQIVKKKDKYSSFLVKEDDISDISLNSGVTMSRQNPKVGKSHSFDFSFLGGGILEEEIPDSIVNSFLSEDVNVLQRLAAEEKEKEGKVRERDRVREEDRERLAVTKSGEVRSDQEIISLSISQKKSRTSNKIKEKQKFVEKEKKVFQRKNEKLSVLQEDYVPVTVDKPVSQARNKRRFLEKEEKARREQNKQVRKAQHKTAEYKYVQKKKRQAERKNIVFESKEDECGGDTYVVPAEDVDQFDEECRTETYISTVKSMDQFNMELEHKTATSELRNGCYNNCQIRAIVDDIVKQLGAQKEMIESVLDMILKVVGLTYLVRKCKRDKVALTALIYMILSDGSYVLEKAAMSSFISIIVSKLLDSNVVETLPSTEAASDYFLQFNDVIKFVYDSTAMDALRNVIVSVAALKVFPKHVALELFTFFGRPNAGSTFELLRLAIDSIAKVLKVGELILEGVPLTDVLFMEDPINGAIAQAKELLIFRDKTYVGLPTPGYMERRHFMGKAQGLIKLFDGVLPQMGPRVKVRPDVFSYRLQLMEAVSSLECEMNSKNRITPFAIILHGKPAIGKSKLLLFLAKLHADVKGFPYSESLIYDRQVTSQYWEGYMPYSHPYIHYSEIGSMKSDLAKNKGDPVIAELTSLIDSLPHSVDMAFDRKGKVFATPDLVLIDTNNESLNIEHLQNNPAAYRRRFLYIEPIVKPQYRKEGSCAIDPVKCKDDTKFMDRWVFRVYRIEPIDNVAIKRIDYMTGAKKDDIHRLARFMRTEYSRHIAEQDYVKHKVEDPESFSGYGEDNVDQKDDIIDSDPGERKPVAKVSAMEEKDESPSKKEESWSDHGPDKNNRVNFKTKKKIYRVKNVVTESRFVERVKRATYSKMQNFTDCLFYLGRFILIYLFYAMCYMCTTLLWNFCTWNVARSFIQAVSRDALGNILVFKNYCKGKAGVTWLTIKHWFKDTVSDSAFVSHSALRFYFLLTVSSASLYAIYTAVCFTMKKLYSTESLTDFRAPSEENSSLSALEERFGCGSAYERVRNKLTTSWNSRVPLSVPVHTSDAISLDKLVRRNVRVCKVLWKNNVITTHLMGIRDNFAVINTHAVGAQSDDLEIHVSKSGRLSGDDEYFVTKVTSEGIVHLPNDVSVVRLSGVSFKNIEKHVFDDKVYPECANGMIGDTPVKALLVQDIKVVDKRMGHITLQNVYQYSWKDHTYGMCGLPLCVDKGNGAVFIGIHVAGDVTNDNGYAASLNMCYLRDALLKLKEQDKMMPIYSESSSFDMVTESPAEKSAFRYESLLGVEYHGKIPGSIFANNTSKLQESVFSRNSLEEKLYEVLGSYPTKRFGRPMMKATMRNGEYISPVNLALKKMSCTKATLDPSTLNRVIDIITDHIIVGLEAKGVRELCPLNMETAINGDKKDYYSRRIQHDTAAGFGYGGIKSTHIPIVEETLTNLIREPTDMLKARLREQMDRYANGERNCFVYNASLKDEPREISKCLSGNTRVFYASPVDNLVLSKMFLQPFYTRMCEFGDVFCTAIGVDMHRGADELFRVLTDFSDDFIEGDYEKFDIKMPFDIGHAESTIIVRVLKHFGYNSYALGQVCGLLNDNLFVYIVIMMDLLLVSGLQPSGKYGTAESNSLRGLIMLVYAWVIHPNSRGLDFFECVLPRLFGDDVLAAVKETVSSWFNNHYYASVVKDVYGMGFTSSTKDSVMKKLLKKEEVSFLKRKFVFRKDLSRVVAPLDGDSIYKSLNWIIPSKALTRDEHYLSICGSALREIWFWVGNKHYDMMRCYIMDVLHRELQVPKAFLDAKLSTYYSLYSEFMCEEKCPVEKDVSGGRHHDESSKVLVLKSLINTEAYARHTGLRIPLSRSRDEEKLEIDEIVESELISEYRFATDKIIDCMQDSINDHYVLLEQVKKQLEKNPNPFPGMTIQDLRATFLYNTSREYRSAVDKYTFYFNRKDSISDTIASMESDVARMRARKNFRCGPDPVTESAFEMKSGTEEKVDMVTEENVIDTAGNPPTSDLVGWRLPSTILNTTQLDMTNFLRRPARLATYDWAVSGSVTQVIDVWSTYFNLPSVRSKLRNSAYIFANMKVRINLTGTPFHAGKLMVAYIPMARDHEIVANYISAPSSLRKNLLIYLSQTPGCKIMDVKDNSPLDVSIPLVSPKRAIRLFNDSTSSLAAGTNFSDTTNMGTLFLYSMNTLGCVASSPSDASIYVYAHLEDVVLGCTTGTQIAITTESRDERISGPIERFATRSAEVADALTTVPIISPYARASEIVLRAVANVAAIFGFSVPVMNTAPSRVKNEPFQNEANLIGYDTGKRIVMDPKQEISVDPRIGAVSDDEMSIAYVNGVSSYLDTATWFSSASIDVPFWRAVVNPRAMLYIAPGLAWNVQPTALAYAATPFTWWRGSIDYTIQVVCSAFHRGKLAVYYEPNIMQSTLIDGGIEINKEYIHIFDLQDTQEIVVRVEWAYPRAWARVLDNTVAFSSLGTLFTATGKFDYANGYIGLFPITELTSPDDSSVAVNVYVKSEDMMFNVPRQTYFPSRLGYDVAPALLGDEKESDVVTEAFQDLGVDPVSVCVLNPSSSTKEGVTELHFGEVPVSFRALLKRFAVTLKLTDSGDAGLNKTISAHMTIIPLLQPSISSNMGYPCLLNYLRPAYLCMRGGLRKRIHFSGITAMDVCTHMKVSLDAPSSSVQVPSIAYSTNPTADSPFEGTVTFVPHTNGGIECELPFYTNNLFGIAGNVLTWDISDTAMETLVSRNYTVQYEVTGANLAIGVAEETATGEDFSLVRWIAAPPYTTAAIS